MAADILDMSERKRHLAAQRGFQTWTRRFGLTFADDASLGALPASVIRFVLPGGDESATALYELAMGFRGLGAGLRFHFLESRRKIAVMDLSLFLLDLFRFEAMRRLGWTHDLPSLHTPIADLVEDFPEAFPAGASAPALRENHPRYAEYLETFEGDRAAFVRRLIPEAIEAFCKQENDTPDNSMQ